MSDSLVDCSESHLVRDGLGDYQRAQNKSGGSERCLRAIEVTGISLKSDFVNKVTHSKCQTFLTYRPREFRIITPMRNSPNIHTTKMSIFIQQAQMLCLLIQKQTIRCRNNGHIE